MLHILPLVLSYISLYHSSPISSIPLICIIHCNTSGFRVGDSHRNLDKTLTALIAQKPSSMAPHHLNVMGLRETPLACFCTLTAVKPFAQRSTEKGQLEPRHVLLPSAENRPRLRRWTSHHGTDQFDKHILVAYGRCGARCD